MSFKFERIIIWQKAMVLGEQIQQLSALFPKKERYNLTQQITRAADSIALNIAEGSISQSNPEFRRFVGYAIRSLAEVVTCLLKARHRSYTSDSNIDELYNDCYHLMNMMVTFKRNIR
ncbi:MAG: four helix bundle protein [Bacteroidota bacterium]